MLQGNCTYAARSCRYAQFRRGESLFYYREVLKLLSGRNPAGNFPAELCARRRTGKHGATFRLASAAAGASVLLGRVQPSAEGHAARTFRQPGAVQALFQWRQSVELSQR